MAEVIGAGFGRTGTLSMKAALEVLGHRPPCYCSFTTSLDLAIRSRRAGVQRRFEI